MSSDRGSASRIVDSPVGRLHLTATERGLTELAFLDKQEVAPPEPVEGGGEAARILDEAERQLAEYFERKRLEFDLPLSPAGTEFQLETWKALSAVPFGETIGYAELARRMGRPDAVRAVGAANGANPIAIVIPCHRVIGADGNLTGYGGGLHRKKWLLEHEMGSGLFSGTDLFSGQPLEK